MDVTGVQRCALQICVVNSGKARPLSINIENPADCRRYIGRMEIGRASWREREEISVVAVSLKKKKKMIYGCDWSSEVCSSDLCGKFRQSSAAFNQYRKSCRLSPLHRSYGDRKSVVEGKRGDLGSRRIIKKKKKNDIWM